MADDDKLLAYRVRPGEKVRLGDHDPHRRPKGVDKDAAVERIAALGKELAEAQELLYGAAKSSLLVVLQGMDTSGKDGAIRRVFAPVNPAGVVVTPFKAPSPNELAQDFLWRVHVHAPARSMIAVWNRSHYEDVLIVRVKNLVPEATWRARYAQINAFEEMLAANGTIIVKCFLHISRDEQEKRLLAREQDPVKAWKLDVNDWIERERWDDYQKAYGDALGECSTAAAPWYIVPGDAKWARDLAIAELLAAALRPHVSEWRKNLAARGEVQRAAIAQYHAGKIGK